MSRNDDIDFIDESTFKNKLPKLYQIVINEGLTHGVDLNYFDLVHCESFNDIIEVNYTDHEKDLFVCVKGSEKKGYRLLNSTLDDSLDEEDYNGVG